MHPEPKTIAIVGSGAIGSYYGARLVMAGFDVRFLLRSDLARVKERGSIIIREHGKELVAAPVSVFGSSAEIGPVDLVLIALKSTANQDLRAILPPLIGPTTAVVTLQNGLGNEAFLSTFLDRTSILGGLCSIGVNRTGPGELKGFHTPGYITLGEAVGPATERTHAIAACFVKSGVRCDVADSLVEAQWRKLIWNIPFNGLSIVAGAITTDKITADPALVAEVKALMREVAAIALAEGFVIPESFIEKRTYETSKSGAYQPSSLIDFLAGREVEVEAIWAEPLRRAQALGVETPRLSLLCALLKRLCRH